MSLDQIPGAAKASADVVSATIVVGTVTQLLPHISAVLTIVWMLIRIFETDTLKGWRARRARPVEPAIAPAIIIEEKTRG
jgi:hypothetical protein